MRYAAAFAVVLLGLAAWHFWPSPVVPVEAPLRLPAKLRLVQRHDAAVPGSDGRLRIHIGDITRGQVGLTLSHRDGRTLIPRTSVRQGDRRPFSFAGRRYTLTVRTLRNNLIGDDWAVLEITEGVSERDRIEQLLAAVAASDAVFIRNGKEYDGAEAAAHWRRKWKHVGDRIETAEQFVEHIASRSSLSGRAYHVRLKDGRTLETGAWLRALLAEH